MMVGNPQMAILTAGLVVALQQRARMMVELGELVPLMTFLAHR
jgi:hypothetical protein